MTEQLGPRNISGLKLEHPIMNGAGPVKTVEDVRRVAKSRASAIFLGSITLDPRDGNKGRTYAVSLGASSTINSKGLPNPGLKYYLQNLPEMVQIANDHGKPLVVSLAGFSPEEYAVLTDGVLMCGVNNIELNLGCPNAWGEDGAQKPIASFNTDLAGNILHRVGGAAGKDQWIDVKVSPFSDPLGLVAIAAVISESGIARAVTTSNTFPNAFAFDFEDETRTAIDPAGGLGGMAGEALKPIALGQVKQLRAALPPEIGVIGVGGISTSRDVREFLRSGADAVQVVSAYINVGPEIFGILLGEK
jgi:dihydroorotate dehydrogenase (fumarate)